MRFENPCKVAITEYTAEIPIERHYNHRCIVSVHSRYKQLNVYMDYGINNKCL